MFSLKNVLIINRYIDLYNKYNIMYDNKIFHNITYLTGTKNV